MCFETSYPSKISIFCIIHLLHYIVMSTAVFPPKWPLTRNQLLLSNTQKILTSTNCKILIFVSNETLVKNRRFCFFMTTVKKKPTNNTKKQDSLANELRVMVEFIFGLLTLYYSHGLWVYSESPVISLCFIPCLPCWSCPSMYVLPTPSCLALSVSLVPSLTHVSVSPLTVPMFFS